MMSLISFINTMTNTQAIHITFHLRRCSMAPPSTSPTCRRRRFQLLIALLIFWIESEFQHSVILVFNSSTENGTILPLNTASLNWDYMPQSIGLRSGEFGGQNFFSMNLVPFPSRYSWHLLLRTVGEWILHQDREPRCPVKAYPWEGWRTSLRLPLQNLFQ